MAENFPAFENFTPPDTPNESFSSPNQINFKESIAMKTVRASKKVRVSTNKIIRTRADFKKYLLKYGMDIITSAIEFNRTTSFKYSSYIVYLKHDNKREKLISFLTRYPQFKETVDAIELNLKKLGKNSMSFSD